MDMPVDRTLWRHPPFPPVGHVWRKWRCPSCASGALRLKAETLHFAETRQSREGTNPEDWSARHYLSICRFVGILECNSRRCSEVVVVAGSRETFVDTH